ncbi:hypothetical protein M514_06154, partial [Trichuris suis]
MNASRAPDDINPYRREEIEDIEATVGKRTNSNGGADGLLLKLDSIAIDREKREEQTLQPICRRWKPNEDLSCCRHHWDFHADEKA